MLKFKPTDFVVGQKVAEQAQKVFDAWIKKNGKVVYKISIPRLQESNWSETESQGIIKHTHKALLINIEPLKQCTHPKEKITAKIYDKIFNPEKGFDFFCECGKQMKPAEFKEV